MKIRLRRLAASALAVLPILVSADASAQCGAPPLPCLPDDPAAKRSSTRAHVETAAVNAALGGVTAGVLRVLRGGSLREGLASGAAGAAGGALVYAGKRVAVERWDGAGFVGREVAAVGSSVVWNASAGRGMLDRVVLPIGPVRLYVATDAGFRVTPKLDVSSTVAMAFAAGEGGVDWTRTLSAGAPVFHRRDPFAESGVGGRHAAGVIVYHDPFLETEGDPSESSLRILAHEQVHVIQHDQAFLFWSEPAEEALLGTTRAGRALRRHLDLGLDVAAAALVKQAIGYENRPWEREAYLLSRATEHTPEPRKPF